MVTFVGHATSVTAAEVNITNSLKLHLHQLLAKTHSPRIITLDRQKFINNPEWQNSEKKKKKAVWSSLSCFPLPYYFLSSSVFPMLGILACWNYFCFYYIPVYVAQNDKTAVSYFSASHVESISLLEANIPVQKQNNFNKSQWSLADRKPIISLYCMLLCIVHLISCLNMIAKFSLTYLHGSQLVHQLLTLAMHLKAASTLKTKVIYVQITVLLAKLIDIPI